MTREEHLLGHVAEECAETAQRALKAQKFGLEEAQTQEHDSNKIRLIQEFNDIVSIMKMLQEEGYFGDAPIFIKSHLNYKRERVNKYLNYAMNLGKLKE